MCVLFISLHQCLSVLNLLMCQSENMCVLCFSADVLSGSVNEPLEPGGVGEERPRALPHPLTADHHKDQRGERTKGKGHCQRECIVQGVIILTHPLFHLSVC